MTRGDLRGRQGRKNPTRTERDISRTKNLYHLDRIPIVRVALSESLQGRPKKQPWSPITRELSLLSEASRRATRKAAVTEVDRLLSATKL